VASRRQLEEPRIFQGEIQQDVSRPMQSVKNKRKTPSATTPAAREHRHKTESANARTEHGKESAGPIEQEQLEPGISNFVDQFLALQYRFSIPVFAPRAPRINPTE